MRRRLVGEIVNLRGEVTPHPSTPLAKLHNVMITSTVAVSNSSWISVEASDAGRKLSAENTESVDIDCVTKTILSFIGNANETNSGWDS